MAAILALLRLLPLPVLIALGGLIYYEGLPGFARIPYLVSVPVLGDLTAGRVAVVAAKARAEGREAGAFVERQLWQAARAKAEDEAAKAAAALQAEINAADMSVEIFRKNDRLRAAAFEAAMREQRDEDQKTGVDRSHCDLPDRVWNATR
ncbi:hypothetical protein [Rhizobium sp. AG855]|uniref:hypothetical protein n=1 Tax=Rhizobium sp. AG855 TaxID=2183898 RepID=UPI000E71AAA4|nr:hypothetical protein [Rhizobium sp. AG855]RKE84606.1 hypothetical protein DFO46_1376 [Rhizobium sp. AG855]